MNKLFTMAAIAALLTAPAFAQTVYVGVADPKKTDSNVFINGEYVKDIGLPYDLDGIAEARISSSNQHVLKAGVQREIIKSDDGILTLNGRANLTQKFGKNSATGWSVEPTASFKAFDATVTLGYEFGDTFKSKLRDRVRTMTAEATYPTAFGDVGLRYENAIGSNRESSISAVYVFRK